MGKKKIPTVTASDYQIIDAVAKAMGVQVKDADTWEQFAEHVDQNIDTDLGFALSSLRVIPERLHLYSDILHPTSGSFLLQFLEEDPGSTFLIMDRMMSGKQAPHIVRLHDDMSCFAEHIAGMRGGKLVANTIPGVGVVSAVSLHSFLFQR